MPDALFTTSPVIAITLALLFVISLVVSDYHEFRPGRYVFKPLAALMFVWLAINLGALDSSYGHWLLAGLLCCLLGDLLLMPDHAGSFLAGLVAFLTGHLLYGVAFVHLGDAWLGVAVGAAPALGLLVFTMRWLMPHVPRDMRTAVIAYIVVITGMLLSACLTLSESAGVIVVLGAWGFALSDLAVARQRFVRPDRLNGLWGTPLYFGAQMLLAASAGYV